MSMGDVVFIEARPANVIPGKQRLFEVTQMPLVLRGTRGNETVTLRWQSCLFSQSQFYLRKLDNFVTMVSRNQSIKKHVKETRKTTPIAELFEVQITRTAILGDKK